MFPVERSCGRPDRHEQETIGTNPLSNLKRASEVV